MIPLTKTLHPNDFALLEPEMRTVDQFFTAAREQHPMRRWEYSMALRAQATWYDMTTIRPQGPVVDVGGAGSPFWRMVNPEVCRVVDPAEGVDLAEHLRLGASLASEVYCLSVLEHVDNLDQFLYHLSCLVAPGGLLFLTMDCWNKSGTDTAHFHWMRKRIFAIDDWTDLAYGGYEESQFRNFQVLGEADWTYHGNHVYDYSFASLALVKRS